MNKSTELFRFFVEKRESTERKAETAAKTSTRTSRAITIESSVLQLGNVQILPFVSYGYILL